MRYVAALVALMALGGATSADDCKPAAPDIPDDLQLVCHDGTWHAFSRSAQQVMVFRNPCGPSA